MGSNYFVSATSERCVRDGISLQDITRVRDHLLAENEFDDPYLFLVADVNNDGFISVNDLVFIQFLLLQLIQEFPVPETFIIARSDMVFSETNPLPTQWQSNALIFEVSNLSGPALVPDYVAYKLGDTTLSSNGSSSTCN